MKPYLTLFLAFLMLAYGSQTALGQPKTLSQGGSSSFLLQTPVKLSGFASPLYEYSVVEGDFTLATGGGMALLINQQLFVGAFGLSSNHNDRLFTQSERPYHVQTNFSQAGLWIGYIHQSDALLHGGLSVKVAGGSIRLEDERIHTDDRQFARDGVFVLTPQLEAELNVLKWMKLNAGLGYRVVSGVELSPYNNAGFSSLQGTFTLMFGWFDQ